MRTGGGRGGAEFYCRASLDFGMMEWVYSVPALDPLPHLSGVVQRSLRRAGFQRYCTALVAANMRLLHAVPLRGPTVRLCQSSTYRTMILDLPRT